MVVGQLPGCSREAPGCSKMYQNLSKCVKMYQHVSNCFKIRQKIRRLVLHTCAFAWFWVGRGAETAHNPPPHSLPSDLGAVEVWATSYSRFVLKQSIIRRHAVCLGPDSRESTGVKSLVRPHVPYHGPVGLSTARHRSAAVLEVAGASSTDYSLE